MDEGQHTGSFARSARAQARVVVAHPDRALRRPIVEGLRRDGCGTVVPANNGHAVVTQLTHWMLDDGQGADLAILGTELPGWSGLELVEGIRDTAWDAPVILVASEEDPHLRTRARAAGVRMLFTWPFQIEDLRTVALYLLRRRAREDSPLAARTSLQYFGLTRHSSPPPVAASALR
jgi:DNA-binding response OmpR family regulator